MPDLPPHDENEPPQSAADQVPVRAPALTVRSLMSQLEAVQTDVLTSTERVRRAADNVVRAAEDAATELRALREQVEEASGAVNLIAASVPADGGGAGQIAPDVRERVDSDATTAPAVPTASAEHVASSAVALLEDDEAAANPDAPGHAQSQALDAERARLAAVNMALTGIPREETARRLAESFELNDAEATTLLNDVYRLAEDVG